MERNGYIKAMLELREKLYAYYFFYDKYIRYILRFILFCIAFAVIAGTFGYEAGFEKPWIVIGISLISTFLPDGIVVFVAFLYTIVQLYFLSPVIAGCIAAISFVLYFMLVVYNRKFILTVLFIPVCIICKVPFFIPIILGLFFTPASVLSAGSGIVVYYAMCAVKKCETLVADSEDMLVIVKKLMDSIVYCKEMYAMLIMVCMAVVLTYMIRVQRINYAFELAIVFSVVSSYVVLIIGNIAFQCKFSVLWTLHGAVLSGIFAFMVHFVHMVLDYGAAENVQFEDAEYYYYVSAVPKLKMTVGNKKVKRIYERNKS